MNIDNKVHSGSIMHGVEHNVGLITLFEKNILFVFCACCLSVYFIYLLDDYSNILPHIYCIIFPLFVNWCYICFIYGIAKILRIGFVLNWWIIRITILYNSSLSITSICTCGFNSNIFQLIVIKTWHHVCTF